MGYTDAWSSQGVVLYVSTVLDFVSTPRWMEGVEENLVQKSLEVICYVSTPRAVSSGL